MYKDYRYFNAGDNEFHRWGHKAQEKVASCMTPNENGFYSIPADGGRYWTIGTSEGKYGTFAKFGEQFLSVNKAGFVWAKVGSPKEEVFLNLCRQLIADMKHQRTLDGLSCRRDEEDEDED